MPRVRLEVSGMHCGHCVDAVRKALAAVPGTSVEDVRIGEAVVAVEDSRAAVAALIDAVYDAGYEAQEAPA